MIIGGVIPTLSKYLFHVSYRIVKKKFVDFFSVYFYIFYFAKRNIFDIKGHLSEGSALF